MPNIYQPVAVDQRPGKARPSLRPPAEAEELFNANRRLAWRFLKRRGMTTSRYYDDLLQAALVGLWRACELFDPSLGFKLSTYADRWMRQAVGRELRNSCLIHVPQHVASAEADALAARLGALPGEGADRQDDAPARGDWGPPAQDLADRIGLRDAIEAALLRLPRRYALVIRWRYLDGLLLEQIGQRLGGITREAVRQLELRGLAALARRCPGLRDAL